MQLRPVHQYTSTGPIASSVWFPACFVPSHLCCLELFKLFDSESVGQEHSASGLGEEQLFHIFATDILPPFCKSHSFSTSRISRAFLEIFRNLCQGWTSGRGKQDNRTDGTMQSSRPVCNVHPRAPCRLHFTKLLHAPDELFHPPS